MVICDFLVFWSGLVNVYLLEDFIYWCVVMLILNGFEV